MEDGHRVADEEEVEEVEEELEMERLNESSVGPASSSAFLSFRDVLCLKE